MNNLRLLPHRICRGIVLVCLLASVEPHSSASNALPGPHPRAPALSPAQARIAANPAAHRSPLTTVAQARRLTPEQARQSVPLKLRGVVTALPGFRNSFFLEDATAGISVDRTDHAEVHVGDLVEVRGVTGPGFFAPVALASAVTVLGRGAMPLAPKRTLGDLFGGLQDSQWIELTGVVRKSRVSELFGRPIIELALQVDGGVVNLLIQGTPPSGRRSLIDSSIRVRGVCSSSGNPKRQFVGSALLVPDWSDLVVNWSPSEDPFAAPSFAIPDILRLGEWRHRIRVAGVVTYQVPGQALYLQQGFDGIRVDTESRELVPPGTSVEAVGFPASGEYAPFVQDGVFRSVGQVQPVAPLPVRAGDVIKLRDGALRGAFDEQLVRLQATVLEDYKQGNQRVWILREDAEVFEARLLLPDASATLIPLAPGSTVAITGICTIHSGSRLNPTSFSLLVRSSNDVVVLKHGPWWTPRRTYSLLTVLLGLTALAMLWVVALRSRVERQTRAIRESEARFRYLSEHDELTGLLNRRAALAALDERLARGTRKQDSVLIILADIDHFKRVNDIRGHLAGDAALRRFTKAITTSIRPYDIAGRYGGEEFLIVMVGIAEAAVEARLLRLQRTLSNLTVSFQSQEFTLTCSVGAVWIGPDHAVVGRDGLLSAADEALYEAKREGRNRAVLYGPLLPGQPTGEVALSTTAP